MTLKILANRNMLSFHYFESMNMVQTLFFIENFPLVTTEEDVQVEYGTQQTLRHAYFYPTTIKILNLFIFLIFTFMNENN